MPLEDVVVTLARPTDLALSPDGSRIAYLADPYGHEGEHPNGSIWVAPTDGRQPARHFTSSVGRDEHPRWSPDGRQLAFLSDRQKRGTKALYRMPVGGGEATSLLVRKRSIDAFEWSPDGARIAFVALDEPTEEDERREQERDDADVYGERWRHARLHVLDVASGEVRTLPTGEVHVTAFSWSPDGTTIAYTATPTPELEELQRAVLYTISATGGEPKAICPVPGWSFHLTWASDRRTLFYVASHEAEPQSAFTVWSVDTTDGEPRIIGPGPDEDACGIGVRALPGETRVVIAVARGLTTRLEWLDPATRKRELLYEFPEGDLDGQSFAVGRCPPTTGGALMIAAVQSAGSAPPEVHSGSPGRLSRISDHHAALRQFDFGAQEPFFWTAPDGLQLDGLLIRPPNAIAGPLPTVVLVHGGPYGRWSNGWNLHPLNWAQLLAAHGYAVLLPNCRGGMGHGNAFAIAARADVGGADFRDIMAAVDAAIERGIADPARLGIGGWSQGGFMTAWAVTQTDRFKAGVMGAGVSDWGMMVATSDLPTFEATLGGDRPWDGPGPHRADQRSPISYAKNVGTPLLILHGQHDQRVPVSQAIGFGRALREHGVAVQLVTYPREGHRIGERNHQRDVLRRVRQWYDRWL